MPIHDNQLSITISRENRTNASCVNLGNWLAKINLVEQADDVMDKLLAITILLDETVHAYLPSADGSLAQLDSA